MAEKEPDKATCPRCASHHVPVASRKSDLPPRSQTGNLKTDLAPISTTLAYKCQECGHEWSETTPL